MKKVFSNRFLIKEDCLLCIDDMAMASLCSFDYYIISGDGVCFCEFVKLSVIIRLIGGGLPPSSQTV